MRKKILLPCFLLALIFLFAFLNIKVTTKQGVDYRVSRVELPLYLKVLNFYGRHFNYKWLAERVVGHLETKEEKIFRLFQWTHEVIRHQPESLPVMDDHVWNVYVRGYGVSDNHNDLFSTLCNYIGVDAFMEILYNKFANEGESRERRLSFVSIERGWVVFDPYHGVYFANKNGDWATVDEIKNQNWTMVKLAPTDVPVSYYKPFLEAAPVIKDIGLRRANVQSPVNRLRLELVKIFSN